MKAMSFIRPLHSGQASTSLCDAETNWVLAPVKVVKAVPATAPEKAIKLKSIQAALESAAVVVRLEYEAPADKVTVWFNGTAAEIRRLEVRKKDSKAVGGVVYAALAQRLSRREDPDRRIQVDVAAEGYDPVSTEVRAIW